MDNTITTELWNLRFFLKGKRICFIARTPQGVESRHWADLSPRTMTVLNDLVDKHLEAKEAESKLTWEQRAEKYREMSGGS
jgi:hypothetical protein